MYFCLQSYRLAWRPSFFFFYLLYLDSGLESGLESGQGGNSLRRDARTQPCYLPLSQRNSAPHPNSKGNSTPHLAYKELWSLPQPRAWPCSSPHPPKGISSYLQFILQEPIIVPRQVFLYYHILGLNHLEILFFITEGGRGGGVLACQNCSGTGTQGYSERHLLLHFKQTKNINV